MEFSDLKRFINITPLYSKGIKLRRIIKTDLEDVYEYASDPVTSEFLLWSICGRYVISDAFRILQKL